VIELADGVCRVERFAHLKNFVIFPSIDSTNALASGLIDYAFEEEVDLPPTAIAALEQTAGRGRGNRTWLSPSGGLYVTFLCAAPEGAGLSLWPLAAGLWVHRTLETSCGLKARLKWPNDLLCAGRKIAGILTEAKTRGAETRVAIGIGTNVLGAPADALAETATTIEREKGERPSISGFFTELCARFEEFLDRPEFERIAARWEEASVHRRGDVISVRGESEGGRIEGAFEGLTPEGFLRLNVNGKVAVISAGEIERP
jgi:BirA family biotin operon repressor/biotin-[acetyl-CoA-carboxylase] ligase